MTHFIISVYLFRSLEVHHRVPVRSRSRSRFWLGLGTGGPTDEDQVLILDL